MAINGTRRVTLTAAIAVAAVVILGMYMTGDASEIARGKALYAENCASCHGDELQGQPDWKSPLPNGRYPAPPHDEAGHTWHHPDVMLMKIIRDGTAAVVGGQYESDMPGFGDTMSDSEIAAVLAYIKLTWPKRERRIQSRMTRESIK